MLLKVISAEAGYEVKIFTDKIAQIRFKKTGVMENFVNKENKPIRH